MKQRPFPIPHLVRAQNSELFQGPSRVSSIWCLVFGKNLKNIWQAQSSPARIEIMLERRAEDRLMCADLVEVFWMACGVVEQREIGNLEDISSSAVGC